MKINNVVIAVGEIYKDALLSDVLWCRLYLIMCPL